MCGILTAISKLNRKSEFGCCFPYQIAGQCNGKLLSLACSLYQSKKKSEFREKNQLILKLRSKSHTSHTSHTDLQLESWYLLHWAVLITRFCIKIRSDRHLEPTSLEPMSILPKCTRISLI